MNQAAQSLSLLEFLAKLGCQGAVLMHSPVRPRLTCYIKIKTVQFKNNKVIIDTLA
jgi:hypothetical protein